MALRILGAVFGEEGAGTAGPEEETRRTRTYPLTPFQEAAAIRVRRTLDGRGGVLLADAVGLGKTYVALAIAEERLRAGGDVVVIVPAALRPVWSKPLRRIARAAGHVDSCRVLSHTQMSRGATVPHAGGLRLIIVDEAHRFRNPAALRYRALTRIIADGRRGEPDSRVDLLLITATPVNNTLADLYHLVRLFLPDDGLRGAGVPSLRAVFEADPPDPVGLRSLVRELVVRRSRPMVERRYGAIRARPGGAPGIVQSGIHLRFPGRAPPRIHRYGDPAITAGVEGIEGLELTAYGVGTASLVRLGLLKRMESSPAAFVASLRRLRGFLEAFVEAARAGRLLHPGDRAVAGDGDPLQLPLLGIVAEPSPPDIDLAALAVSAAADSRAVDALIRHLPGSSAKERALVELLESLPGERVLVFTEYRDTAASLWQTLAGHTRVARIDGSGAWLGAHPAGRRAVVERFAPTANGRPEPSERERVEVLVATDVLAEGLNLQDARHVVSYDLPWNPVRLLQRIGRVDRLGSPHDEVVPHLFAPAHGLDAVLGLTRRLRTKLHGISTALDEPQVDALLQGLAAGRAAEVETAILAVEDTEHADPWERLRTLWLAGGSLGAAGSGLPLKRAPEDVSVWAELPALSGENSRADRPSPLAAVVLTADAPSGRAGGSNVRLLEISTDGEARPLGSAGADVLARAVGERHPSHSAEGADTGEGGDSATPPRPIGSILAAVAGYRRTLDARGRAPVALSARDPAARLARRIRRLMADAGAGLSPSVVHEAEEILRILAGPLSPATELAVTRILDESAADDPLSLFSAARAVLPSVRATGPAPREPIPPESVRVRAVLLTSPKPG